MNILVTNDIIDFECLCLDTNNGTDIFFSIASLLLGVITILVGNYVSQKRKDAKYGFYINLLIYVKRLKPYFEDSEYKGVTDFLCKKDIREKVLSTTLPEDRSQKLIPIYVSLCKEFIKFISQADNIIEPKSKILIFDKERKKIVFNKKCNGNNWYNNLIIIVEFIQICQLLGQGITPYVSNSQAEEYKNNLNEFKNALNHIENELSIILKIKK